MNTQTHESFMQLALQLARHGRATVSPNPAVGCVLVRDNEIVGRGFHQFAGGPHAEIHALSEARSKANGGTAYITLEPCCHFGRTPPCVDALIKANIKKVVIATIDPNPQMAGKSIALLRQHHIEVEVGIHEAEAMVLNKVFFHFIRSKKPFVIAKWAMSFDGKTITQGHDSLSISSANSRAHAKSERQYVDAILIGANTARRDNPQLTARDANNALYAKQPKRIILSSNANLPLDLDLFTKTLPGETIVATSQNACKHKLHALLQKDITVWQLPSHDNDQVDLHALLAKLGKEQITSLLIEGGETLQQSFFNANLIDHIQVYLAPNIIAKLPKKAALTNLTFVELDQDFYFTADTRSPFKIEE